MIKLPHTMGATVWLRKGKVLITGAIYLWPHLTQERDLTSASAVMRWCDLSDADLGRLLRDRLESTRRVSAFPDQADVREEVQQFTEHLAGLFGLKTTRGLFPGMKQINVFRTPPQRFDFHPNKNRGRGFFQEFSNHWPDKQPFGIPFYASDAEIGAATRLAMEKSI